MTYKCSVCGMNEVSNSGETCSACVDPFAQSVSTPFTDGYTPKTSTTTNSGSSKRRNILLNGGVSVNTHDIIPATDYSIEPANGNSQNNAQIYQHGQAPSVVNSASQSTTTSSISANGFYPASITTGITKNVNVDKVERSLLFKWFRSVFSSIPFTFDNYVTTFQVFPDYSGQSLNKSGYACDQVMIYGQIPLGFVSENNDVEIFGHRDSKGNIIASAIKNTASGTTVTANWSFHPLIIKVITLSIIVSIVLFITAVSGSASMQATLIHLMSVVFIVAVIAFLVTHPSVLISAISMTFRIMSGIFRSLFRRR